VNENLYGIIAPDMGDKAMFDADTRGGLPARLRMNLTQLKIRRCIVYLKSQCELFEQT
jgi:hypothetical protein